MIKPDVLDKSALYTVGPDLSRDERSEWSQRAW